MTTKKEKLGRPPLSAAEKKAQQAKRRAYTAEWQRNHPEKVREYRLAHEKRERENSTAKIDRALAAFEKLSEEERKIYLERLQSYVKTKIPDGDPLRSYLEKQAAKKDAKSKP